MKTKIKENSRVILFLISQSITTFGSSLVQFALIWYISIDSKSGTVIALSTLAANLPQIIISIFGGVLADRYNRKNLIIVADLGIALSSLVLVFLIRGGYQGYAAIMIVMAIRAAGAGIQTPAISAVLPQLTEEEKLYRINAINSIIQSIVLLATPFVAGMIMAQQREGNMMLDEVIMIDIVTAVIGVGILLFIKVETHKTHFTESSNMILEFKEGIRYAKSNFFLRKTNFYSAITALCYSPGMALNVLLVVRVFGDTYENMMLNEVAFFIGMLIGGGVFSVWKGFKNKLYFIIFGGIITGVITIMTGVVTYFPVYLLALGVFGFIIPCFNIPFSTLIQEKVDTSMLGRSFSIMQILSLVTMTVSTLVFGPIADIIPIQYVMIISGVLTIASTLYMYSDKKYMEEGFLKVDMRSPQGEV